MHFFPIRGGSYIVAAAPLLENLGKIQHPGLPSASVDAQRDIGNFFSASSWHAIVFTAFVNLIIADHVESDIEAWIKRSTFRGRNDREGKPFTAPYFQSPTEELTALGAAFTGDLSALKA